MTLRPVPPPPDYPEHLGRRVTWRQWQHIRIPCLPPRECPGCGGTSEAWFAHGLIHPHPGETFEASRTRTSRRHPHRQWEATTEVPAWPHVGLAAFRCPDCPRLHIYDTTDGFTPVDIDRPTLF